jgi:hypothetical protein
MKNRGRKSRDTAPLTDHRVAGYPVYWKASAFKNAFTVYIKVKMILIDLSSGTVSHFISSAQYKSK